MVIGNKNGNSEKLLSMEKDLYPDRFEFWQKIKRGSPGWFAFNLNDEQTEDL